MFIGFENLARDKVNYPIVPSPRWENECEIQVFLMEGKESKSLTQISGKLLEWMNASRPPEIFIWYIIQCAHRLYLVLKKTADRNHVGILNKTYWKKYGMMEFCSQCDSHVCFCQMEYPFIFNNCAYLNKQKKDCGTSFLSF